MYSCVYGFEIWNGSNRNNILEEMKANKLFKATWVNSLIFFLLILCNSQVWAGGQGCAISATPAIGNLIYIDEISTGVYRNQAGGGNSLDYDPPPYNQSCPGPYYINFTPKPAIFGSCKNCKNNGNGAGQCADGYLVTYTTRCDVPIDDYVPYALLGIVGLGFVFIRKRNLAL